MPPTSGWPVVAPQASQVQLVNVGPHEQAHLNKWKPGTPAYYNTNTSPEERERLRQEARMRNIRKEKLEKGGTRRRSKKSRSKKSRSKKSRSKKSRSKKSRSRK